MNGEKPTTLRPFVAAFVEAEREHERLEVELKALEDEQAKARQPLKDAVRKADRKSWDALETLREAAKKAHEAGEESYPGIRPVYSAGVGVQDVPVLEKSLQHNA